MSSDAPVIRVEQNVVEPSRLAAELRSYVKRTGHTDLLLKHGDDVPFGTVVTIQDDAKKAGMERISLVVPP